MSLRIEGYVILSADGMLADAAGVMPETLKFDADQRFFEHALDHADLIVHGRNSYEDQPRSALRRRVIVTRQVAALAPDPANPKATLWNPASASFDEACRVVGVSTGLAAIIGGPGVFGMFLDRTTTFWLSRANKLRLPGGKPGLPEGDHLPPEEILAGHGLAPDPPIVLDAANDVTLTAWRR